MDVDAIVRAIVLAGIAFFLLFVLALAVMAQILPLPLNQRVKVAAVFAGVAFAAILILFL